MLSVRRRELACPICYFSWVFYDVEMPELSLMYVRVNFYMFEYLRVKFLDDNGRNPCIIEKHELNKLVEH